MTKVEKEVKKVIKDYKPNDESIDELNSFLKASKKFEELVKSGIVTKRGNRQLSIDEAHLKQFSINQR
jgi:flagellar capping protein FliD